MELFKEPKYHFLEVSLLLLILLLICFSDTQTNMVLLHSCSIKSWGVQPLYNMIDVLLLSCAQSPTDFQNLLFNVDLDLGN